MKNSAPNRFIWAHIFKNAPTSQGGTSPLRRPLRRASATTGADAPFSTSKNLPSPLWKSFRRLWRKYMIIYMFHPV